MPPFSEVCGPLRLLNKVRFGTLNNKASDDDLAIAPANLWRVASVVTGENRFRRPFVELVDSKRKISAVRDESLRRTCSGMELWCLIN